MILLERHDEDGFGDLRYNRTALSYNRVMHSIFIPVEEEGSDSDIPLFVLDVGPTMDKILFDSFSSDKLLKHRPFMKEVDPE